MPQGCVAMLFTPLNTLLQSMKNLIKLFPYFLRLKNTMKCNLFYLVQLHSNMNQRHNML